jgi:hypothetical protein
MMVILTQFIFVLYYFFYKIMFFTESFYSVCPEILSYHMAKRCKNDISLDPFCGAGGNIIQLAFTSKLGIITY